MSKLFKKFSSFCIRAGCACCGVVNLFILQKESKRLNELKKNEVRPQDFNKFNL